MKKIISSLSLIILMGYTISCDQNFDEFNTNQVNATAIDPAFQLNAAVVGLAFPTLGTLTFDIGIVQQIISPNSGVLTGANYNQDNREFSQSLWQGYYRNVIKNTRDVISRVEGVSNRGNLLQMARLVQAYGFMVLTDDYGSIPYFDGGKGYTNQVFLPKYDAQQDIYADLIKEVREATGALSSSQRIETADVLYAGNIDKWKAFGNSLLLRLGMRLSEVDPALAQQVVSSLGSGPFILDNTDNAAIRHDNNYQNPTGNTLNSTEASNFYLTQPFVDFLKNSNDPRLSAIAVRYVGASSGPEQTPERASFSADLQIGMPMGNDNAGAVKAASDAGLASFYEFSQADRRRVAKLTAPNFLITASQTNLLLAEARHRGWISSGSAEEYFHAGIRAHMVQLGQVDAGSMIPPEEINAFLQANPLIQASALEQINDQYWIASFLNGPEAFANFRRSGFPALAPNPFPGREVPFINRLTYPNSEISVNAANVQEAISLQGPDEIGTKVWWDK
ncbi:SusD/RagB family nutrient-binding outer membrane lipoprotein [Algoriphagus confluentis]|uniref:SusD/RagB family nutrient-binding outer membrane lipoprotein n=1 Tax=Algoriphagus confluentis TaxID=1697556 RepID=A0ABQ6PMY8_9BACT|nr:SusD/RagB family nutrient-binding outer membrane lipoprotein [Algoriphagus confluentis]